MPTSFCKLNLSIYLLKFNSLKISKTFGLSHSSSFNSSKVSSIGTFVFISPNVLERYAKSLFCSNFSFCFPFTSASPDSNFAYKLSIVSYFCTNERAVFSPIPGTPGMLSDVSPCNPFTSINCFGSIP